MFVGVNNITYRTFTESAPCDTGQTSIIGRRSWQTFRL